MHKTAVALAKVLGVLAIVLTGLWCLAGAGIYGSPLGHFHGGDLIFLFLLLLIGPLSILPAGLLGRKRPGLAGIWLLSSSLLTFFLILGGTLNGGFDQFFRASPTFEAAASVAAVCSPLLLLGLAFLKAWVDARTAPLPWRQIKIAAGVLMVLGLLAWGVVLLRRPIWTLTVSPAEGPIRSLKVDARSPDYVAVQDALAALFKDPPSTGRKSLGSYELSGPPFGGGRLRFDFVAERTPERLVVYRNETFFTAYRDTQEALAAARRGGVNHILSVVMLSSAGSEGRR